jgi:3D (Asp-Asp-Asp) domain-containing protein
LAEATPRRGGKGWLLGLSLVLALGGGGWWLHARRPPVSVVLFGPSGPQTILTRAGTVGGLIEERSLKMGPRDVLVPPPETPIEEGMEIDLGLVEREVVTARKQVKLPTKTVYTDTLGMGEILDVEKGQAGLGDVTTESYTLNGVVAFEKVLETKWITPPKASVVYEGTSTRVKLYRMPKRYKVARKMTLEGTAYYPGPEDTGKYAGGITASGMKAGYGVVAVDPKLIRMKTPLYIEGYGFAWAADVGGAIKGRHIDLCYDTYEEAVRFGRKDVQVYILK